MKLNKDTVYTLVQSNIERTHLEIINQTSAVIYISKGEQELSFYETNGYPLKQYSIFKCEGLECYKGAIYGITDTNATDVRVFEL